MSIENFNKLTPAQAERLAILAEECGEVIQIVGKILRHGLDSHHPVTLSNRNALVNELTDVKAAMVMISMDVPGVLVDEPAEDKAIIAAIRRKLFYSHHQEPDFSEYLATLELTL